jgi:cytochrome b561
VRLRNNDSGYGLVTKTLHWLTVAAIAAQFTIGYLIDGDSGHGGGGEHGSRGGSGHGSGDDRGGVDDFTLGFGDGDDTLVTLHVMLGLTILTLAVLRLAWRRATSLPPWAPGLSTTERTFATWTERLLYLSLFLIPLSGLSLVFLSDDLLAFHITSHIIFFTALAAHLGLVLKHQLIDRDGLLRRMT